jgi:hypothetical protein
MTKKVKDLNANDEHESLNHRLNNVKRLGVHTMEGRNELMDAKEQLLNHLKADDEALCPELEKNAVNNDKLVELVDTFKSETRELVEFCNNFFNKYAIYGGGIDFLRDFDKLEGSLVQQIKDEEKIRVAL